MRKIFTYIGICFAIAGMVNAAMAHNEEARENVTTEMLLNDNVDVSSEIVKEDKELLVEENNMKKNKNTITHVKVTCYQPVEAQCDSDPLTTADGSKIDLYKLKNGDVKWCAISRDLLWLFPKDKPKRVHIEGYGIYEVRDVMNKRFKHRVDILIHPSEKANISEENVKMTILG